MDYLHADGLMAKRILPLTQALLIVSAIVVVIIAALVLIAVLRHGRGGAVADTPLLESPGRGWISIGVGLSTVVLVGFVVWTSITMARNRQSARQARPVDRRPRPSMVVGVRLSERRSVADLRNRERDPHSGRKAGALHPQRRRRDPHLLGSESRRKDSNHSRADQRDLASGRQARRLSRPVLAILRPAARAHDFLRFRRQARTPSRPGERTSCAPRLNLLRTTRASESSASSCAAALATRCAAPWPTAMSGPISPTSCRARRSPAASLPNNPGYLSGWIANPQNLKPGSLMPNPELSGPDLASIRSFLVTLK